MTEAIKNLIKVKELLTRERWVNHCPQELNEECLITAFSKLFSSKYEAITNIPGFKEVSEMIPAKLNLIEFNDLSTFEEVHTLLDQTIKKLKTEEIRR